MYTIVRCSFFFQSAHYIRFLPNSVSEETMSFTVMKISLLAFKTVLHFPKQYSRWQRYKKYRNTLYSVLESPHYKVCTCTARKSSTLVVKGPKAQYGLWVLFSSSLKRILRNATIQATAKQKQVRKQIRHWLKSPNSTAPSSAHDSMKKAENKALFVPIKC